MIGKTKNKNIVGKLKKCCIIWDLLNRKKEAKFTLNLFSEIKYSYTFYSIVVYYQKTG